MNDCWSGWSGVVAAEALHREHLAAVGLDGEVGAGADRRAVDQHRAGAADLEVAGALGALQVEPVAEHVEQERVHGHVDLDAAAIDRERDAVAHTVLPSRPLCGDSARRRRWPMARLAAMRSARRRKTWAISRL